MAHAEQKTYCESVKKSYPKFFLNRNILDCGSLDINGNNRYLFEKSKYIGVDVGAGKNVDVVSKVHELKYDDGAFDFVISTEMLEHDTYYSKSLQNMVRMLSSGGMMLLTCATSGRKEHGTRRTTPSNAPLLLGELGDYYQNLTENDILSIPKFIENFSKYEFSVNLHHKDLQFYGIKK